MQEEIDTPTTSLNFSLKMKGRHHTPHYSGLFIVEFGWCGRNWLDNETCMCKTDKKHKNPLKRAACLVCWKSLTSSPESSDFRSISWMWIYIKSSWITSFNSLTSISKFTTPVDRLLGFFFLWIGFSCVGVPLVLPSFSPTKANIIRSSTQQTNIVSAGASRIWNTLLIHFP